VIVCFVDIGGIVDHHCLEVIVRFVDIGGIVDQQNEQSPLNSDGLNRNICTGLGRLEECGWLKKYMYWFGSVDRMWLAS
jgi:hypothetical protein